MRRITDNLIALLVPLIILLHLYAAPYSKVEESFNLQAIHDILAYGIPLRNVSGRLKEQYDHLTFTGFVPRTFVGPLALAGASWPFAWLVNGVDRQILVRALLGLYNAFSILAFRNAVAKEFGRATANWYILLQASQFHIMFYSSRTLPNFFAFGLVILALRNFLPSTQGPIFKSQYLKRRHQQALVLLTVLGVVLRSEIAILLGTNTIWLFVQRRISLNAIVTSGLLGLCIGLGLTVPVDSFFWQRFPLWPELSGFIFNIIENKSQNWGTSPFHAYLTDHLPRLLLNPLTYLVCIPLTLATPVLRPQALNILIPNLSFIAIYSLQPHKELRFIAYVVPSITVVAAMGASWIWTRRSKSMVYQLLALSLVASTACSLTASLVMLTVSNLNYPGADALNRLHALADTSKPVISVHMDILSCSSGVTRFLERPPPREAIDVATGWRYNKTEDDKQLLTPEFWDQFDYVLAERPEKVIGSWEIVHVINGFDGIGLVKSARNASEESAKNDDGIKLIGGKSRLTGIVQNIGRWIDVVENLLRKHVTKGWWLQVRIKPKIRILKNLSKSV